jgi:protein TonB
LARPEQHLPFDVAMGNALFSPEPDDDDMLAARTAKSPNPLELAIEFCVNTIGKTVDVQVVGKDPDPALSKVVISTMSKWRFKPFKQDDKPIKTCTERKYRFEFD